MSTYADWNALWLLRQFGSTKNVCDVVAEAGYAAPNEPMVKMWKSRRSIPSRWLATLILVGRRKGYFTLEDLARHGIKEPETDEVDPFS